MADAQDVIDRRRLRRKLGFWRLAAIVFLVAAILMVPLSRGAWRKDAGDQIARVSIEGVITEDDRLLDLLKDLKDEDAVKAVILRIDSPGGTTTGGETIFDAVRRIAAVKPVAAEIGSLGASAGYLVALAADHIVAHRSSIVGSIGVLFQYVDASSLLGKVGVDVNAIKSSPLKAEPSPFAPAPEAAKAMIQRLVMAMYGWFVDLVAERRPLSREAVLKLADGSVFSGDQGLANRLVDAVGGEPEVLRWLEEDRGVPKGLKVVDRKPEKDDSSWFGVLRSALFEWVGLDPKAATLGAAIGLSPVRLDGLLSLWQPSLGGGQGQ